MVYCTRSLWNVLFLLSASSKLFKIESQIGGFLDGALRLGLSFDSNQETVLMLNQLTVLAEKNQHHPDLTINQLNVSISIFTHDVNGITEKDFVLAEEINNLLKK